MTGTERKLDEAKYFFSRLDVDDPYFDYNLSAFLNAARSITWIMRHEFNEVENWEDWFINYDVSTQQKQLLQEVNELRIESTKQAGIKTNFFFLQTDFLVDEEYYSQVQKFRDLEAGEHIFFIEPFSDNHEKDDEDSIRIVGEISRPDKMYDGVRETLKGKCKVYIILMEDLVKACVDKFVK